MFIIFLEKYLEKGITNIKDINGGFPLNIQKQDTSNVMVLVKNLTGLKNMYQLVSIAHKDNFGNKKPRVTRSDLERYSKAGYIKCNGSCKKSYRFKKYVSACFNSSQR